MSRKVVEKDWILDCGGENKWGVRSESSLSDFERWMHARRFEVDVIAEGERNNLCYEYDEIAILHLDGRFGLAETSGCSCPSPSETWDVREMTAAQVVECLAEMAKQPDWASAVIEMRSAFDAWRMAGDCRQGEGVER